MYTVDYLKTQHADYVEWNTDPGSMIMPKDTYHFDYASDDEIKDLAMYRKSHEIMNGSFFDKIGVADMEKVHSAVIGWIFSDDCCALNKQQKSVLLCSLFNVRPVQIFNSFEVKAGHHDIDILMTFENEQPQCTNNVWMQTTYKDFSKALKDALFNANRNDDYIILKEYLCYISNLASWQEVPIEK